MVAGILVFLTIVGMAAILLAWKSGVVD